MHQWSAYEPALSGSSVVQCCVKAVTLRVTSWETAWKCIYVPRPVPSLPPLLCTSLGTPCTLEGYCLGTPCTLEGYCLGTPGTLELCACTFLVHILPNNFLLAWAALISGGQWSHDPFKIEVLVFVVLSFDLVISGKWYEQLYCYNSLREWVYKWREHAQ